MDFGFPYKSSSFPLINTRALFIYWLKINKTTAYLSNFYFDDFESILNQIPHPLLSLSFKNLKVQFAQLKPSHPPPSFFSFSSHSGKYENNVSEYEVWTLVTVWLSLFLFSFGFVLFFSPFYHRLSSFISNAHRPLLTHHHTRFTWTIGGRGNRVAQWWGWWTDKRLREEWERYLKLTVVSVGVSPFSNKVKRSCLCFYR